MQCDRTPRIGDKSTPMLFTTHSFSTDCRAEYRNFFALKLHMAAAHPAIDDRCCALCGHLFDHSVSDAIDVAHYDTHGLSVYQCLFCDFGHLDALAMETHLSERHANMLPYLAKRAVDEADRDDALKVYRLQYGDSEMVKFWPLSQLQINFMKPDLAEYTYNAGDEPSAIRPPLIDADLFRRTYDEAIKSDEQLERLYDFDVLELEHGKEISEPVECADSVAVDDHAQPEHLNSCAPDEFWAHASNSSGAADGLDAAHHEATIQLEIDNAARSIVGGSGIDDAQLFRCVKCPGLTLNMMNFVSHMADHSDITLGYACYHCGQRMMTAERLRTHTVRKHGVHRYLCSCCDKTTANERDMDQHFEQTHFNTSARYVPLNPNEPDKEKAFYVACPLDVTTIRDFGMRLIKRHNDQWMQSKRVYGPEDVHLLPVQPLFSYDVQCQRCTYKTKVRTNMHRHLMLNNCTAQAEHGEMGAVNPVPSLHSAEKHADKMKNLAASSSSGDAVDSSCEFVAAAVRYQCGGASCQFRARTANTLRQHIDITHSLDRRYSCPHCGVSLVDAKPLLSAQRIVDHLKFHESTQYKCSACHFVHHTKQDAESHITEAHPEAGARITVVVRGAEPKEASAKGAANAATFKWKCNVCTTAIFDSRPQIKSHLMHCHRLMFQYQCSVCPYQHDMKTRIKDHLATAHGQPGCETFKTLFERIESVVDNTPIWRRDDSTKVE